MIAPVAMAICAGLVLLLPATGFRIVFVLQRGQS